MPVLSILLPIRIMESAITLLPTLLFVSGTFIVPIEVNGLFASLDNFFRGPGKKILPKEHIMGKK